MDKLLRLLPLAVLAVVLGYAAPSAASPTWIQSCNGTAAFPATTVSCTMAAPVGAGNTLIVSMSAGNPARLINSITATSDTCTRDTGYVSQSGTGVMTIGSCLNITANTPTITATWDGSATSFILVEEYSGILTTGAFDTAQGGTGNSATGSATTPAISQADELVFGFVALRIGDPAAASGNGCTERQQLDASGQTFVTMDKTVSAIAAQTCSETFVSTNWNFITATYRATASTDTTPPSDPTGLTLSNVTSVDLNVSWTASTDNVGVSSYDLQRCSGAGCVNFATIASPTSTSFPDSGLTANTSYSYRVRARDAAGNLSGFSATATTTTIASNSRLISWTPNPPFTQDGFSIFRCVTTGTSCAPNTQAAYALATSGATNATDASSGSPTSCYQVQATLAGTSGSGLSNIACGSGTSFTLSVFTNGTGGGTATPSGTNSYLSGSVVGLTATPNVTSDFAGWSGDADCTDGSVTMSAGRSCTATFNTQEGTFAYVGNRGTAATKTLSNTISVTPSATVSRTNLLIVRATTDNIASVSGSNGEHVSITDTLGNQYVKLREETRSGGAAGNGVTTSLWASRPFASVTTQNSVTLRVATSVVANTIALEEFKLAANTTFATGTLISNVGASGNSTTPAAVLSGLSSAFRLFLANVGVEGPGTDGLTQGVNYASGTTANGTVGGATTANVTSQFGFRRQTSTGDSYNPTITPQRQWAVSYVALATAVAQNASSLTLTNSGTGGGTVTGAGTYYNGTNVTITAIPNGSSQFVAWQNVAGDNCASTTSNQVIVQLTQNTTCNAVFNTPVQPPQNYTLTLATTGTGTGTVTGGGVFASGTTVNITATPNSDSTFDGWSPSICSSGSVLITADTTCTATFTLRPLVVMVTATAGNGSGSVTGSGSYITGSTAILTATPNTGSVFSGWSGSPGCTGSTSPLSVLMDASKTCTATFTVNTGQAPAGVLTAGPGKRCSVYYTAALTSGGPIKNVYWQIDGVTKRTSDPGIPVIQTASPFTFRQSLVKDGALVTAIVTDTSGNAGTFGPAQVACP